MIGTILGPGIFLSGSIAALLASFPQGILGVMLLVVALELIRGRLPDFCLAWAGTRCVYGWPNYTLKITRKYGKKSLQR